MNIFSGLFGGGSSSSVTTTTTGTPSSITSPGPYAISIPDPYAINYPSMLGTYKIPYSKLDVEGRKTYLRMNIAEMKAYQKELEELEGLSPQTVELLKLVNEPKLDLIKVDAYVKSLLFNSKLNDIINEEK